MTLMIIFIAGLHLNGMYFPLLFSLWFKSIKSIKKVLFPLRFLPLFFLSHLHWCPFYPPTTRDFSELPPRYWCQGFEHPLWQSGVNLVFAEMSDYRGTPVLFLFLILGCIARRGSWSLFPPSFKIEAIPVCTPVPPQLWMLLCSFKQWLCLPRRCWISVWRGIILVYTQWKPLRCWPLNWASSCSCREEVGWVPKSYSF